MTTKKEKIFTGKRKNAVARIRIKTGNGKILVNGSDYKDYFKRKSISMIPIQPLNITTMKDKLDIYVNVHGGGLSGQAGALRHAIAKALVDLDPKYRVPLKRIKLLTRDPRVVERKKYGHKGARKSFQFSKR